MEELLQEEIKNMIAAWEKLPPGNHTVGVIQNWIIKDLKPAIDRLRDALDLE